MDDDAVELIRRRRHELLTELAELSEALRRLMEIEEEAEQHEHHDAAADDARFAYGAGDMAAAGPENGYLSWMEYATSEPGDEETTTQLAGYQENDDDDIWGPVLHQAVATGRLYVPRIQSTSASLDSDVQAYAYHHHHHGGGGGAPALASDDDDDSPYDLFATAGDVDDEPSSDGPEHPATHHLEHLIMHDQDYYSSLRAAFGGPELTPFRSGEDGGGFGAVPASAAAIAALRKQRYDGTGADGGCVICFRDFKHGRRLAVMPCAYGHRFHRKCLRKWLKRSNVCPLCRYALPTE